MCGFTLQTVHGRQRPLCRGHSLPNTRGWDRVCGSVRFPPTLLYTTALGNHRKRNLCRCLCSSETAPLLVWRRVVVYTDHKPLLCLFSKSMANTKIQRWAILLAEYGANIKYRPGNNNIRADMLSRLPPESVGVIDASQDYTDPPGGAC